MLKLDIITELNSKNLRLARQIRSANGLGGSSDEGYAFIITGLKLLFPKINDNKLRDSIGDGYNDADFDAIIFNNKKNKISIFNFTLTDGFNYKDIRSLRDNIELLVLNPRQRLNGLNIIVKRKIERIRRLVGRGWKIDIYIIRCGLSTARQNVENLISILKDSFPAITAINFLTVDALVNKSLDITSQQCNYEWNVSIEPGNNPSHRPSDMIVIRERKGGPIKSIFARVRLKEIVRLQTDFVDNKHDLFDANVRDFQKSKKLSNKIIKTIRNNSRQFYIFHNGLTFSCSAITPINLYNYRISNPQIINGCQTVSAIYDAYKDKLRDPSLRHASILCRFYSLSSGMIEKVCEATNTQLKINLWDLRSNDEIQKILELALDAKGIDYKRKMSIRVKNRVFITDLAQWLYSCKYEKPAEAKNKKTTLFDLLITDPPYLKIFQERIRLSSIARICEIAFFTQKEIKRIGKRKLPFGKDADLHIMAAIYKLENKAWSLERKFSNACRIVKTVVRDMRNRYDHNMNYNKIFTKKEETWDLIKQKLLLL